MYSPTSVFRQWTHNSEPQTNTIKVNLEEMDIGYWLSTRVVHTYNLLPDFFLYTKDSREGQ